MKVEVILRSRAEQDLAVARSWYEAQRPGLGEVFLMSVLQRLEAIRNFPDSNRAIYGNVRRAIVRRFPYLIFYLFASQKVVVLAVLHTSRSPVAWPRQ